MMDSYENQIIKELIQKKVKTTKEFFAVQRERSRESKKAFSSNIELLKAYRNLVNSSKIKTSPILENLLKTRKIRTLSGIASITVITKPYPCPGRCIYCPDEIDMPKSYLANEPACMRAVLTKFDPYKQVQARLNSLQLTGHATDKIELIVLGGTWSAYPKNYQTWFIKRCFDAANEKKSKDLKTAQRLNEKVPIKNRGSSTRSIGTKNHIIGLTLETRPDHVTPQEIKRIRGMGCTRVELGIQSIYDEILKHNKRGNSVIDIIRATKLLKDAGLKVTYHMMLNLPGSTLRKDEKMFEELFSSSDFQPDQLKIYPCVVLKTSPLYKLWKQKKYKPYSQKQLVNLLIKVKKKIPPYVRIIRIIRDIPSQSIVAGNKASNLRQLIADKPEKDCKCIRCREPRGKTAKKLKLFRQDYLSSDGPPGGEASKEIFLSYEDPRRENIYAFLRLRITDDWTLLALKKSAIIRELHTYGQVATLSQISNLKSQNFVQHKGLGRKLMAEAEKIVVKETNFRKVAVISGIGVREYYRKLGYKLKDGYMFKKVDLI